MISDGVTAAEGRNTDLIMARAKRLQAARGTFAKVEIADHLAMTESGLSADQIGEVGQ